MTEAEFVSVLGSEWGVGNGKVDWFSYAAGKVSNEYVLRLSSADTPLSLILVEALTLATQGFQSHRGPLERIFM
jgi:hypothetical protein